MVRERLSEEVMHELRSENKVSAMGKAEEECSVYAFKILLPISDLEPLENNLD